MDSGVIGEYFTICELLRLNFEVVVPPSPQNKGWDIMIIQTPNGKRINHKIQIKTVRWPPKESNTKPVVTGNFEGEFDSMVVVVLDFYKRSKYALYVIPKSDIVQSEEKDKGGLPSNERGSILYKNTTIPFSTFRNKEKRDILNRRYRNNWQQIKK